MDGMTEPRKTMKIGAAALGGLQASPDARSAPFEAPKLPPGVIPKGAALAMDWGGCDPYAYANSGFMDGFGLGIGFIGYPVLAELIQIAEFRNPSEIYAEEMTRMWIKLRATGDDKAERIAQLEDAMKRYKLREVFRTFAEHGGFYGRSQIFPDLGVQNGAKLQTPLILSDRTIAKGSLKRFAIIEPYWTSATDYNSSNPLAEHFYRPQMWFVMGERVHTSRLLTFVPRPVADILKPAYNFGGMSLTQLLMPAVEDWLRTAKSVSDLLHSFTIPVLKTDMGGSLMGGGSEDLQMRAMLFNAMRDNKGLMTLSKGQGDTDPAEELEFVSAPLGGLDHLKAQTQERMCASGRIPSVKLFGITPSGLNVSSDGEVRSFYDSVSAAQSGEYGDNLKKALDIIQLSEFGEVDPDITYTWEPLWQMDDTAKAAVRKTESDIDAQNITSGVVDPEEVRERLARQEDNQYVGIDLSGPPPEPPVDPALDPEMGGSEGEKPAPDKDGDGESTNAGSSDAMPFGMDTEFKEGDHPRDDRAIVAGHKSFLRE
jgi:phage-related protein (TIGR01555 family)